MVVTLTVPMSAGARGPENFSDIAEKLLPSVVNISTTQMVDRKKADEEAGEAPLEEWFRDYFDKRRGDDEGGRKPAKRLHHRQVRLHRYQQPRHRERR